MVLEEIAMYEDDPQDQIHDLVSHAVFPDQALGRPVIGTGRGDRRRSPRTACAPTTRDHYTAPNMVVAAAGNVAHERVMELSEELLGDLSPRVRRGRLRAGRARPRRRWW